MKEDPEFQTDDDSPGHRISLPRRGKTESEKGRLLPALLIVLLLVICVGGVFYFISTHPKEGNTTLQSKKSSLEDKVAGLEEQIGDLQRKSATGGSDPILVEKVEALSQKVEALEKQIRPILEKQTQLKNESKSKSSPSKQAVTAKKQYHTVQKGETLFRISEKYGISVEELCKLNGIAKGQPVRAGQKLLVSEAKSR